ncbi:MAG TPA: hypothetical protein VL992_15335 [Tepidisphaeraceae bacterium]|nr:hypothetical protein [Tepidisphaeraceae bacterium]
MSSISLSGASQFQYPQLSGTTLNPSLDGDVGLSPAAEADGSLQATNPLLDGLSSGGVNGSQLFQTLQSAVASALQAAGSDSTSGANQIIQQAIEKAITQAGSSGAASTSTSGSSGSTSSSTSDSTSSSGSAQSLFQLLSDFGVNVQQFQSDFQDAVQQVQQGGQADPANIFASFPNGLAVDTVG